MAALHPEGAVGKVALMRRAMGRSGLWSWKTAMVAIEDLNGRDLQLATHASMHRFGGWRRSDDVVSLNSVYMDLDYHGCERHKHRPPEEVMALLRDRLYQARVPEPSHWLYSGRGIQLVWLLDPLPASALPRVRALQQCLMGPKQTERGRARDERTAANELRMAGVWEGLGLDRSASDVARVFRIAGSHNEKSGRRVRLLSPAAWSEVRRYDLDYLCDAILPFTRDEMAEIRAERVAKREAVRALREERDARRAAEAEAYGEPVETCTSVPSSGRRFTASADRWHRRVEALTAIRQVLWRGTVPEGYRNRWALHVASAWSYMERGDLRSWAAELAPLTGLPESELTTNLRTTHDKLLAARRGETVIWRGQERDPRYAASHARVISDFDLSAEDVVACGLKWMLRGGAAKTATERSAERRVRDGAVPRASTVEKRHADGLAAHAMKRAGQTMAEITEALGRGLTSLKRAMTETADRALTAAETVIEAAEAVAEVAAPTPVLSIVGADGHSSARSLVAQPIPPARGVIAGVRNIVRTARNRIKPVEAPPDPSKPVTLPTYRPVMPSRSTVKPWARTEAGRGASSSPPPVVKTVVPSSSTPSPPSTKGDWETFLRSRYGPGLVVVDYRRHAPKTAA